MTGPPDVEELLKQLRPPGPWDRVLGGWLLLLGTICLVAACPTLVMLIPGLAMIEGGRRILRGEPDGARLSMAGVGVILLGMSVVGLWWYPEQELGQMLVLGATMAVPVATLVALVLYDRHPVNRYRAGVLNRDRLERELGEARFNALIHRLDLERRLP